MTIDSSKMQTAQELIEDEILSVVPRNQWPRMLYYFAKENEYGASDGPARYQRSPRDGDWVWMAVVETPPSFAKYTGMFLGVRGEAVNEMVAKTGCYFIRVEDSIPKYIFLCARDMDMANKAVKLIEERVQWVLEEGEKRRHSHNYRR